MNDNISDNNSIIKSLNIKLEQEQYKLQDSFMEDLDDLISNDRYREFIFVSHNYISEIIDNIILNYFSTLELREEFKIQFNISKLGFSKKLNIINKSNLIPNELFRVLDDYNKIRNIVAHNVYWLDKLDELNNIIIDKDKESLYNCIPLWLMFLILYLDFSKRSNEDRKQLDRDVNMLIKGMGITRKDLFLYKL